MDSHWDYSLLSLQLPAATFVPDFPLRVGEVALSCRGNLVTVQLDCDNRDTFAQLD